MTDLNFNEFPPSASYEEWKNRVQKELGEKPFESIVWKNENGFDVQPYQVNSEKTISVKRPANWELFQSLGNVNDKQLNALILQSLMGGSNAIGIDVEIQSQEQLMAVLANVEVQYISLHFLVLKNPLQLAEWLVQFCFERKIDSKSLKGSFRFSGINLSSAELSAVGAFSKKNLGLFRMFTIDATEIHESGASVSQEIAFALAMGNEHLHRLCDTGISIDEASAMLQFNFATGSSYFEQIAKYRVFRSLWNTIVNQYQPKHDCSGSCFIHASTSRFLQTSKDNNNNLLRSTTQCMSAILGGANSVNVIAHDALIHESSDASLRLARNIQQLLIEESYLDRLGDAAEGSYYIDALSVLLAESSWKLFQDIESKGGIVKTESEFRKDVHRNLEQMQSHLVSGKKVIVGVNKYQNKNEHSKAASDAHTLTGFLEKE